MTRRIIAKFAPDELSGNDEKLENIESLSWSTTPTGMTRLVAELSPSKAAILKEAISAKSAPRPATPTAMTYTAVGTGTSASTNGAAGAGRTGGTGATFGLGGDESTESGSSTDSGEPVRDERSPGKRRVDALMDLLGAGARAATGDGDVIDAGAARRFACTADLIPAVLGGPSQPLDVGRRERLAIKAIRAAVILRDGACTFPGCDRPPGFCEIHHVRSLNNRVSGDRIRSSACLVPRRTASSAPTKRAKPAKVLDGASLIGTVGPRRNRSSSTISTSSRRGPPAMAADYGQVLF